MNILIEYAHINLQIANMKKVNITIGRFQPFTKGHMKCVEEAYKELSVPTIVCMINVKDEKVDEKHPYFSIFTYITII